MKKFFASFLILLAGILNAAVPKLNEFGSLELDGTSWLVTFVNMKWNSFSYEGHWRDPVFQHKGAKKPDSAVFRVTIPGYPEGELNLSLKPEDGHFQYHADVSFSEPAKFASLSLETRLPVSQYSGIPLKINGKPFELPREMSRNILQKRASVLELPGKNGKVITFRGDFELFIQDNRQYKLQDYTIRIRLNPGYGNITRASLDLKFGCCAAENHCLDLRGCANAGFADEVSNDGKGGWTDQGPANDLRMLKSGKQMMDRTPFDIIDPAANGGRGCIVLAGSAKPMFPESAACKISGNVSGSCLYLLHAVAWPNREVGKVNVTYSDGSSDSFEVRGGRDVGNWWAPASCPNGKVVWTAENSVAYVGLYRSRFKLRPIPVSRVEFKSAKRAVWGIVAATVSSFEIPRTEDSAYFIVAGKDWAEIPFYKDIAKGTILDFSDTLDAPAGKYGPLIRRGEKLVFRDRPETPVRFYGTNISGNSFYLDREQADRFADRIAACGFNLIRIHHHDEPLTDVISTRCQSKRLDQLEYLIAALKKRGVYITSDLYVSRITSKGEVPEFPGRVISYNEYKGLFWLSDSVFENWKEFCRNWMDHVNPYTGMKLKDDPALISLNIINEGNIDKAVNSTPFVREYCRKAYSKWLASKDLSEPAGRVEKQKLFSRFLLKTYRRRSRMMVSFIRELGVKCVLSDANMLTGSMLSVMRNEYDFVDNHVYWGGPSGTYTLPSSHNNSSALGRGTSPDEMFLTRLYGKPFSVSEFDFCKPNVYRAEGPLLMASYGGLQDWDILCQFAWSHFNGDITNNLVSNHFNIATDCVKALSNQLGAALFRSGSVRPAPVALAAVIGSTENLIAGREYPMPLNRLGRVVRLGGVVLNGNEDFSKRLPSGTAALIDTGDIFPEYHGKLPVLNARKEKRDYLAEFKSLHVVPDGLIDVKTGKLDASNGQIFSNTRKQTFSVRTPVCEAFILPAGEKGRGTFWSVKNLRGRGVFAALSRDGKPLAESRRILIFHLTDTQAFKAKFSSKKMNRILQWGKLPHMAAAGEAEILLPDSSGMELYALDTAGKRIGRIKLSSKDSHNTARLSVFNPFGQTMLYELIRK